MANLDTIPQEIIDKIVAFVEQEDLYDDWRNQWMKLSTLHGLNKAMNKRLSPIVFKCVTLWLSDESFQNLEAISRNTNLARAVRKLIMAPIDFDDKEPAVKDHHFDPPRDEEKEQLDITDRYVAIVRRYADEQRDLIGQNGVKILSECMNRMPNLRCIEFRLDNRWIGCKELKGKMDDYLTPGYLYSCEKILPLFLAALSKSTSQIKEFYIHHHDPGGNELGIYPLETGRKSSVLTHQMMKDNFGNMSKSIPQGLSTLEVVQINPSISTMVNEFDIAAYNAIRRLLEHTSRLKRIKLKSMWSPWELRAEVADILPRSFCAYLTHLSLDDIFDMDGTLLQFVGVHSMRIEVVKLGENVSLFNGEGHAMETAFKKLREDHAFPRLKRFRMTVNTSNPRERAVSRSTRELAPYLKGLTDIMTFEQTSMLDHEMLRQVC